MKISINARQALDLLEAVVEGNEDYVYADEDGTPASDSNMCQYVHRGTEPGCIVGHALHRAGVPISDLLKIEGAQIGVPSVEQLGMDATEGAVRVLEAAQVAQDDGKSWGEALREARDVATEVYMDIVTAPVESHDVFALGAERPVLSILVGGEDADQHRRDLVDEIQHLIGEHVGEANAWAELADRQEAVSDDDAALLSSSQGDLHRHTVDVLTEAYRLLDR